MNVQEVHKGRSDWRRESPTADATGANSGDTTADYLTATQPLCYHTDSRVWSPQ